MALESRLKLSVDNFNPDADLIEVFSKKAGVVGVIHPNQISVPPSGIAGAIQFSNGSAFASDASNLFWDDTNNRLGVGTATPTQPLTLNTSTNYTGFRLTNGANVLANINKWSNNGGYLELLFNNSYYCFLQNDGSYLTSNMMFGTATSLGARVGIKGSGSTSATTSLLVQNSAGNNALKIDDDRSVGMYATSQLCMNNGGSTNNAGSIRFLIASYSGNSYIDGWSDGSSKATNYPLVIGSRVNNSGSAITGSTTTENGTPVVFGSDVYNASAVVQINSTTRGFLPPRMTTTQKNAIATPSSGLVVYDNTLNQMSYYNGSSWINF